MDKVQHESVTAIFERVLIIQQTRLSKKCLLALRQLLFIDII